MKRAILAFRFPGEADFPTQADQVEMGRAVGLRVKQGGQMGMGFFDGHAGGTQAEASADTVDVGINRESRNLSRLMNSTTFWCS